VAGSVASSLNRVVAVALASCALSPACQTVPETGRKQWVAISASDERQLGAEAYKEQLKNSKTLTSGPDFDRVQRVGRRIADASKRRYGSAVDGFSWDFAVIDTPEVNAWMLPGGKSGVNTGLLRVATSDDELAVVMGHEAAHAIARHGAERITRGVAAQVAALQAAGCERVYRETGSGGRWDRPQLRLILEQLRPGGEADHIGLLIAADAGYDPRAAVGFWKKMAANGGAKPPEFLSTHPSDETRASRLSRLMPQAVKVYDTAKARGS